MANSEHSSLLRQGVDAWNTWRDAHPLVKPDLAGALLRGVHLRGANLRGSDLANADFTGADLSDAQLAEADLHDTCFEEATLAQADLRHGFLARARLWKANLRGAKLCNANLRYVNAGHSDFREATLTAADAWFGLFVEANFARANLDSADFRNAHLLRADLRQASLVRTSFNAAWLDESDLRGAKPEGASFDSASLRQANLSRMTLSGVNLSADLIETNLSHADLRDAKLTGMLLRTNLRHANLSGCRVYGVAAWDVQLDGADQRDLVITPDNQPSITVDDLEVAQFLYLILNNKKIRNVVDSITSKAVLLLGRFTPARKRCLDTLRSELRQRGYLPILFDFHAPRSRNLTETVSTLAHLARFVIADITDAKSIPQELTRIVPLLPCLPVQPILMAGKQEYGMFDDFRDYPWVLPLHRYKTAAELIQSAGDKVIAPAEVKAQEIRNRAMKPNTPLQLTSRALRGSPKKRGARAARS